MRASDVEHAAGLVVGSIVCRMVGPGMPQPSVPNRLRMYRAWAHTQTFGCKILNDLKPQERQPQGIPRLLDLVLQHQPAR